MGVGRFDRDTHQIILKTETTSLVNGGPQKHASVLAEKPVDYNDGEFSNHFDSEFHHIIGSPFLY